MALMALLLSSTLGVITFSLAAPAAITSNRFAPSFTSSSLSSVSGTSSTRGSALLAGSPVIHVVASFLFGPPPQTTSSCAQVPTCPQSTDRINEEPIETITVTEREPPITVTASGSTTTVTDIITISEKPSSSPTSNSHPTTTITSQTSAPSVTSLPGLTGKATWSSPDHIHDLSAFNITFFPGGQKNLKIVTGIPAKASAQAKPFTTASTNNDDGQDRLDAASSWSNSSSALQLFYPANSVNPAQKPQGGAEFYASPLSINTARNVTLQYSVFFPKDFNWVLAGKLPGMYGGHTGCSGGNDALDCFSTRLMWRQDGQGELYLYAAKDKQTKALCSDSRSTCDAAYGFSIGRGSFRWAAGAWTTVQQTVFLNNPGKQDGAFTLDVNGNRVIDRSDVFYRDLLWPSKATTTKARPVTTKTSKRPASTTTTNPDDDGLGDVLGPLLGELGLGGQKYVQVSSAMTELLPLTPHITLAPSAALSEVGTQATSILSSDTASANVLQVADSDVHEGDDDDMFSTESVQKEGTSIGFVGIFFSTFFGGHGDKYATPRDQYVWFKDFAMSYNS